jgi:hypothetical protein
MFPFLGNRFVIMPQLDHNNGNWVFLHGPCRYIILVGKGQSQLRVEGSDRVEAGSNTSTVTLRVVGGDEKGSLKSETVKYCRKSQGTWAQERLHWQGKAAYTRDKPVLSSERAALRSKTVTVKW